jgi:hypothetical protein
MFKSVLGFLILAFSFSCSQSFESKKKVNQAKMEEKESANAKENKPMLFPVVIAGSIVLIQKVYLKRSE